MYNMIRLGQVRLGKVRLGEVRLGKVRIGKARLGQVRQEKNGKINFRFILSNKKWLQKCFNCTLKYMFC